MAKGQKLALPPTRETMATIEGLEPWLRTQHRAVGVAVAVRAALRVLPLFDRYRNPDKHSFADLMAALFRAASLAWLEARYPTRANGFAAAAQGASNAINRAFHDDAATGQDAVTAGFAATAQSNALGASARDGLAAAHYAALAIHAAAQALETFEDGTGGLLTADEALYQEASRLSDEPANCILVVDSPLWPEGTPTWASNVWTQLRGRLPAADDWSVWIDWYEERLRGGSRGEAYEIVFATVPEEKWKQGARAANAWIREHLPPEPGTLAEGPALPDVAPDQQPLVQRAATYSFALQSNRIAVAPENARPEDLEATQDFLDEARRKAAELQERLARAQADERLKSTLRRLGERLAALGELRVGLVISALTSLEADFNAYDTDEGHKEHAPDVIAGLADLADTVRLLVGQYPRAREILANQVALGLSETAGAVEAAEDASKHAASAAAKAPDLVEHDVAAAMLDPPIDRSNRNSIADRTKQAALRLGALFNFGVVSAEARNLAIKSWAEARKQIPKGAGLATKATIASAPLVALDLWLGAGAVSLLVQTAGALAAANAVLGKRGGSFDRVMRVIEKAVAEKAEPPKPETAAKAPQKRPNRKSPSALPPNER